ncbi:hypothetical protein DV515_00018687, partial [Chloebia gouldiae]
TGEIIKLLPSLPEASVFKQPEPRGFSTRGSQGWHKDSCRCCSGTGVVALWSHFKGVIMEHFGGCFWNSICSWIPLRVQQS